MSGEEILVLVMGDDLDIFISRSKTEARRLLK